MLEQEIVLISILFKKVNTGDDADFLLESVQRRGKHRLKQMNSRSTMGYTIVATSVVLLSCITWETAHLPFYL